MWSVLLAEVVRSVAHTHQSQVLLMDVRCTAAKMHGVITTATASVKAVCGNQKMPARATYFLRDRPFAGGLSSGDNLAYFCPTCGVIWARAFVEEKALWHCLTAPCEQHEIRVACCWTLVPGSLVLEHRRGFLGQWASAAELQALPGELLARELQLHLNDYEKGLRNV